MLSMMLESLGVTIYFRVTSSLNYLARSFSGRRDDKESSGAVRADQPFSWWCKSIISRLVDAMSSFEKENAISPHRSSGNMCQPSAVSSSVGEPDDPGGEGGCWPL
jgi:hypothetical protein